MKKITFLFLSFLLISMPSAVAFAEKAPAFSLTDIEGETHSLADFKGKIVVLEWFNPGCPFVKKHYESGNMQKLQGLYTQKGVVWLTVNSSAEGKQGFLTNEEAKKKIEAWNVKATGALVDTDGTVGKLFNAKTTPHLFVIDKEGNIAYQGAIDDNDSSRAETIDGAKNYVSSALDELLAGKAVSVTESEPYGCSVKYKS